MSAGDLIFLWSSLSSAESLVMDLTLAGMLLMYTSEINSLNTEEPCGKLDVTEAGLGYDDKDLLATVGQDSLIQVKTFPLIPYWHSFTPRCWDIIECLAEIKQNGLDPSLETALTAEIL